MADTDKLLESLLYSESEEEISTIIATNKNMNDANNWHPVDNRVTNANTITNQSSSGAKAATELITNMVDAILIKRCLEENIDPKDSTKAPATMYDAVEKLVKKNLQRGKIINADNEWIKGYAETNLTIGITAPNKDRTTKEPCFTFVDNGEGQHSQKFKKTFLSLSEKYKSDISCVQGKYNMGSSGTLGYCGDNWYKLIVSRRYDRSSNWGWTLIRKSPNASGDSMYAEYFCPNGEIPELSPGKETIYPFRNQKGVVYQNISRESGSIIKLYSYYMGSNYNGFAGIRAAFSENMVETILPLRLMDFTVSPSKNKGPDREQGIDPRRFCGMEFLICRLNGNIKEDDDDDENDARATDIGRISNPEIGEISISAFLFREKTPKWYSKSNSRVFHHVNGQTMFKETRGLLSKCKLPSLMDRVAIFVNSSNLKEPMTIWKGDRETIRNTPRGEKYKDMVKEIIQTSDTLKEWNKEIKDADLASATKDIDNDIVKGMISQDPNLQDILSKRVPNAPIIGPVGNKNNSDEYKGKDSPSYIKFNGKITEYELNINRSKGFTYTTDVENGYFDRDDNRGKLIFIVNGEETQEINNKFNVITFLLNGNLKIILTPHRKRVQIGDTFTFALALKDDSMPEIVITENTLTLNLIDGKAKPPNPRDKPPAKTKNESTYVGLPPFELLTKETRMVKLFSNEISTTKWEDALFECNKNDGGIIKDQGDGDYLHYINLDNVYLMNVLNRIDPIKDSAEVSEIQHKYVLAMRIMFLGIESGLKATAINNDGQDILEEIFDAFRRRAAAGAASVVLTLCRSLPEQFEQKNEHVD